MLGAETGVAILGDEQRAAPRLHALHDALPERQLGLHDGRRAASRTASARREHRQPPATT